MDFLKWWRYYDREGTGHIVAQGSVNYNIDPNGELYVIPEIVKKVDARWLLVRKLEIQNSRKDMPAAESGDSSLKDAVMQKIKDAEVDGGIDIDTIIMDTEASPDLINEEIKKLLEEGLVYEPRPGRLRYLG